MHVLQVIKCLQVNSRTRSFCLSQSTISPTAYLFGNRSEVGLGSHAVVQFVQISHVGWLYLTLNVLNFFVDICGFLDGVNADLNFFRGICRLIVGILDNSKCTCKDKKSQL